MFCLPGIIAFLKQYLISAPYDGSFDDQEYADSYKSKKKSNADRFPRLSHYAGQDEQRKAGDDAKPYADGHFPDIRSGIVFLTFPNHALNTVRCIQRFLFQKFKFFGFQSSRHKNHDADADTKQQKDNSCQTFRQDQNDG